MIPSGSLCKEGEGMAKERCQRKQVEKGGPGDKSRILCAIKLNVHFFTSKIDFIMGYGKNLLP